LQKKQYRQIEINAAVEIKTLLCVRAFGKLISLSQKCRIKKEYVSQIMSRPTGSWWDVFVCLYYVRKISLSLRVLSGDIIV